MRPAATRRLLIVLLTSVCSCSFPWLDHAPNQDLGRELEQASRAGLALGRIDPTSHILSLYYFDGRKGQVGLPSENDLADWRILPDALLSIDTVGPRRGSVVISDLKGNAIASSIVRVDDGSSVAISHDRRSIAFIGKPVSAAFETWGTYVAGMGDDQLRQLMQLPRPPRSILDSGRLVLGDSVDWNPSGTQLLVSARGDLIRVIAETGERRKVADGWSARWSPDGHWASFITPKFEAALLNLDTGRSQVIDPGRESVMPLEWSPDGKYILLREGAGSHVVLGAFWVYRVSDAAFWPVLGLGTPGLFPNWIQAKSPIP